MKKVLVVEDDQVMRKMLVEAFKAAGFKVADAPNGEEGLKVALDFKPDAILLDLMMPVMDGLTMLKRLKEQEWSRQIPVTILTNSDESEKIASAFNIVTSSDEPGKMSDVLEKGVFKYIMKSSVTVEDIVKRIAKEIE